MMRSDVALFTASSMNPLPSVPTRTRGKGVRLKFLPLIRSSPASSCALMAVIVGWPEAWASGGAVTMTASTHAAATGRNEHRGAALDLMESLLQRETRENSDKLLTRPSADCGLRIADCGLRIADCGLRTADCGISLSSRRRRRHRRRKTRQPGRA